MLTTNDALIAMLLPLLIGISVAASLRGLKRPATGRAWGMVAALVAGYFCRYAMMNYAYLSNEDYPQWIQRFKQTLFQTTTELLNPSVAIAWVPILAVATLAVTLAISTRIDHFQNTDIATPFDFYRRPSFLLSFAVMSTLAAVAMVRLLWSSIYFSTDSTFLSKTICVGLPASTIAATWASGFIRCDSHGQRSRWKIIGSFLLSMSAMVLLGASGSFSFALLQIPAIAAITVGAIDLSKPGRRGTVNGDAWLIVSGISLPILLGYFFAQVNLAAAAMHLLSALLLVWVPLNPQDRWPKRSAIVLLVSLPAIIAATWAAVQLSQSIATPYGG